MTPMIFRISSSSMPLWFGATKFDPVGRRVAERLAAFHWTRTLMSGEMDPIEAFMNLPVTRLLTMVLLCIRIRHSLDLLFFAKIIGGRLFSQCLLHCHRRQLLHLYQCPGVG